MTAFLPRRLMDLAKEMTKEALPIKCLEAVILGMYPSSERPERGQPATHTSRAVFLLWKGPLSSLSQKSQTWPQSEGV